MEGCDQRSRDRGVFSLPDVEIIRGTAVALDTSFVVRALHSREDDHRECLNFLQRLVTAEATVVFSELLAVELVETAYKLAVIERHGRRAWPSRRLDGRVRRRAGRLASDLMESWSEILTAIPHVEVPLVDAQDDLTNFMALGLSAYDSAHASTAVSTGARIIATTDHGFSRVPEAVLDLATTRARVMSYRRARAKLATSGEHRPQP